MAEGNLSESDVRAVADEVLKQLQYTVEHKCRYDIDPHELAESVRFYKNLNQFFESSWKTAWRVVLSGTIVTLMAIFGIGLIQKFKGWLGL